MADTSNETDTDTVEASFDSALFGSLNANIADKLTDSVDLALTSGVATLPMLKKEQTLRSLLRHQYLKNIDVFEVYCERNIFTTSMFANSRRREIVELFESQAVPPLAKKTEKTETHPSIFPTNLPSKKEIPSADEIKAIKDELADLRLRLQQQKRLRVQKSAQISTLKTTGDLASQARENLPVKILPSIQDALTGTQGLVELQSQGRSIARKMDNMASERDEEDENIVNLSNKRPKTMQERYNQESGQLQGAGAVADLL